MKYIYALFLALCLSLSAFASESGTLKGGLEWNLSDDGVLTISGKGEMLEFRYEYSPYSYAPWSRGFVKKVIIEEGVTSIGNEAFYGCSNLTSVSMPNSVTGIGNKAFSGCSSLTSVSIPNSVTGIGESAFRDCRSLTSVVIPNSVTEIGSSAFSSCTSLTSVVIPNSVTEIDSGSFSGCPISELTVGKIFDKVGKRKSYGVSGGVEGIKDVFGINKEKLKKVTLLDGVTSIGYEAFRNCTSLTSVNIPTSVTKIGSSAFSGCTGLTSVTIPNSVTGIGNSAFYGCSSLTSVNIPNSVTGIGGSAFYGCSSLTSVNIPNSVTGIGNSAFSGCSSLTRVNITRGTTFIDSNAFYGCKSLTRISIPSSVTSIYGGAFSGCSSLTSVIIPNSVTVIGEGAFSGCPIEKLSIGKIFNGWQNTIERILGKDSDKLKQIKLLEGVIGIAPDALLGCKNLTSIIISSSVTSIGSNAFSYCSSLEEITVDNSNSNYASDNGILFSKDRGTLICYPSASKNNSYTIPSGVTSIASSAFLDCSSLARVSIPNSVANIGNDAFKGSSIEELSLGKILDKINDAYTISNEWGISKSNLKKVVLLKGITKIGSSVFSGCGNLSSISIPNSVTSIGSSAFSGCSSLTSVSIPDSVVSIGDYAFESCQNMDTLVIGRGLKTIGDEAFTSCNNIKLIVCEATVPPVCAEGAFADINKDECKLTVPKGSLNAYKNADEWKEFFNIEESVSTGISGVSNDAEGEALVNVYTLGGVGVLRKATRNEVDKLPRGIYIVNGKKVVVK